MTMEPNALAPAAAVEVLEVPLAGDGEVPNNPDLPLLVYRRVLDPDACDPTPVFERLFTSNGWPAAWRDGVYPFQHYHSRAHEALGVCRGKARVQLGGASGPVHEIGPGDVVVIPAGVAHKRIAASADLLIVGAYPQGAAPDMCRPECEPVEQAAARVRTVPVPATDPVYGAGGPLCRRWAAPAAQPV